MAESEQETPVPPGEDPEPMPAEEAAGEESPAEGEPPGEDEADEAGDTHEDPAEGGDEAPTG